MEEDETSLKQQKKILYISQDEKNEERKEGFVHVMKWN